MADQTTRVDITANATQANREFEGWAARVQAASTAARSALAGVASGTNALHAQVKTDLERVEGAIGAVSKRFAAWAALVAGGAVLKGAIDATNAFTRESLGLSKALGINVADASVLNIALGDIYTSSDVLTSAASKLAKQLRTNEGELQKLGITTRDASGHYRNMNDLLMETIKVVGEHAEGVDRTIAMQRAFGKGAEDMGALLKLNNQVLDEARAKQESLGLVVGVNNVEATKRYRAAMNDVGDVLLAVKKVIGDAVMPMFTQMGEWFSSIGPAAVVVIRGAIGGLASVFWGLKNAVVIAWEALDSFVFSIAEPVKTLAQSLYMLFTGDFKGATELMASWPDRVAQRWKGAWASILASSYDTRDRLANLFMQGPAAASGGTGAGRRAAPEAEGAGAAKSRMSQWEADLADRKVALTRQGLLEDQYREMSKAEELRYWAELKSRRDLSVEERIALTRKAAEIELASIREGFDGRVRTLQAEAEAFHNNVEARIAIEQRVQAMYAVGTKQYEESERRIQGLRRQSAEQDKQVRESRLAAERQARLQELAIAEQALQEAQALGVINQQQVLQAQIQFEQRRHELLVQALQDRLQLVMADPDLNPVERERIQREIEAVEQQHQLRMRKLRTDSLVESSRGIIDTLGTIQSGWASLLQQLASGTLTIGGFVKGIFLTVAQAVVQTLAQMVAQWAVQKIAMLVLGNSTALGEISALSAKAGAGGVASMAAAPFPLNMSAPFFGATMASAAMAFAPMVAAEQGFDIPAGVNPMVQAHQREMILPANLADTVRDMSAVYAAGRGTGGADSGPAVEMRVVPMPGDFWMVHRNDLHRALARANKDKFR